jgi:hypothetical protein
LLWFSSAASPPVYEHLPFLLVTCSSPSRSPCADGVADRATDFWQAGSNLATVALLIPLWHCWLVFLLHRASARSTGR